MKAITYIGKKPSRSDNVADTGLSWVPNQVHIVTDAVAEKLLKFVDVWAEVPIERAMAGAAKPDVTDGKKKISPKETEVELDRLERVNVRDMSLTELRKFHKAEFNESLPVRITEETARRKVNEKLKVKRLRSRG